MNWLQTDDAIQVLKTIGLMLFFAIFTGVLLWVMLQRRSKIRRWSELPLDDEPPKAESDGERDSPRKQRA
jgi:cbb3-type cytochrome oxidase subunit 3